MRTEAYGSQVRGSIGAAVDGTKGHGPPEDSLKTNPSYNQCGELDTGGGRVIVCIAKAAQEDTVAVGHFEHVGTRQRGDEKRLQSLYCCTGPEAVGKQIFYALYE